MANFKDIISEVFELNEAKDPDRVTGAKKAKKTLEKTEGKEKVHKREQIVKSIKEKLKKEYGEGNYEIKDGKYRYKKKKTDKPGGSIGGKGTWSNWYNLYAISGKAAGFTKE